MSILSCYLHTSYRTRLFNIFWVERLSWCLHASYHLCFAYIAMIFAQKLPGVLFLTTFILGLKELRSVCMRVIGSIVRILPSYLHKSYRGLFFH